MLMTGRKLDSSRHKAICLANGEFEASDVELWKRPSQGQKVQEAEDRAQDQFGVQTKDTFFDW